MYHPCTIHTSTDLYAAHIITVPVTGSTHVCVDRLLQRCVVVDSRRVRFGENACRADDEAVGKNLTLYTRALTYANGLWRLNYFNDVFVKLSSPEFNEEPFPLHPMHAYTANTSIKTLHAIHQSILRSFRSDYI